MNIDPEYIAFCGTCLFLADDNRCRRYPPIPVSAEGEVEHYWPHVLSTDWCGEYYPARIDPESPHARPRKSHKK